MTRIRAHLRSNIVGYLALLVVMSGSASALQGHNTVFSDDIVDGQVKAADIKTGAVTSDKIRTGHVRNDDIADDAVTETNVAANSIGGENFANNSITGADISGLTGADVNEASLDAVPVATVAGTGRSAQGTSCDPESESYVSCASVTVDLPAYGRVLMHGYGTGYTEVDSDSAEGYCALYTSATGGFGAVAKVQADDNSGGEFGLTTITPPMGPGSVAFEVHCNQFQTIGAIQYEKVGLSVVQIGQS